MDKTMRQRDKCLKDTFKLVFEESKRRCSPSEDLKKEKKNDFLIDFKIKEDMSLRNQLI